MTFWRHYVWIKEYINKNGHIFWDSFASLVGDSQDTVFESRYLFASIETMTKEMT